MRREVPSSGGPDVWRAVTGIGTLGHAQSCPHRRVELDDNGRISEANMNRHVRSRTAPLLAVLLATGVSLIACSRSPVEVDASALRVRASISTAQISVSDTTGGDSTQVTVSVTNPAWRPVRVELGGPPYSSGNMPASATHGMGFGVRAVSIGDGHGPSTWTWGQPTMMVGARATIQYAVTLRAVKASNTRATMGVPPGLYHVFGSFGTQEAVPLDLRVLP